MKCEKCGGLMAYERFFDPFEEYYAWRCVSCGEIIDQVILNNRRSRKP
jgi:hypothetical protein